MDTLTFIIPTYNDGTTIETVVKEARNIGKHLGIACNILVIDDASTDDTPAILSRLSKRMKELTVITHTKNAGYGGTIRELYQKAGGTWLFSVPGDYQIKPGELAKLWPRRSDADMIIGWRRVRRDIPLRLGQSRVYNVLLRLLFRLTLHDANSARLMKTSIMKSVHLTTSSAFVDAELAIAAGHAGFRITEIPVAHRARAGSGAGGGRLTTILPAIRDMIVFRLHHDSDF